MTFKRTRVRSSALVLSIALAISCASMAGFSLPEPAITHLQLADPADLARFKTLGAVAVTQPCWFVSDKDCFWNIQVPHLGKVRADHEYPMQSFFREGVLVASSSDYPVTLPPNPLAGIETGVLRWYQGASRDSEILRPSEHCTIRQMIDSFTINGSKSMLLEKTSGTIEVGRSADLLVLSRNILKISPKLIGDSKHTRVPSTCFQGKRCSTPAVLKQKCGNHRAFGAARLSRRAASVDSRQQ